METQWQRRKKNQHRRRSLTSVCVRDGTVKKKPPVKATYGCRGSYKQYLRAIPVGWLAFLSVRFYQLEANLHGTLTNKTAVFFSDILKSETRSEILLLLSHKIKFQTLLRHSYHFNVHEMLKNNNKTCKNNDNNRRLTYGTISQSLAYSWLKPQPTPEESHNTNCVRTGIRTKWFCGRSRARDECSNVPCASSLSHLPLLLCEWPVEIGLERAADRARGSGSHSIADKPVSVRKLMIGQDRTHTRLGAGSTENIHDPTIATLQMCGGQESDANGRFE